MKTRVLLPLVAAVLAAGPLLAQTTTTTPSATDQPEVETPARDIIGAQGADQFLANSLIGKDVVNSSGESIGEVSDILMEQDGRVVGVVIASGGVLGVGGNKIGVPWQNVTYTAESEEFTLEMTKEQLARAPMFKPLNGAKTDTSITPAATPAPATPAPAAPSAVPPAPAEPSTSSPATDPQDMNQPADEEGNVTDQGREEKIEQ